MRTRLSRFFLVGAAIVASSACAMHVVVEPRIPQPDAITQPALRALMRSPGAPSIVLRVPNAQRAVTQQGDLNQTYNSIEKELVRAGFTVRDRGLLEEVLRSNQNLDYRLIQTKINAQLILEIVAITKRDYNTTDYVRVDNHQPGQSQTAFPIAGWQFECKVILVESGEVGGIYTIDVAPHQNHFLVMGDKVPNASSSGQQEGYDGYAVPLEAAAQPFVQALISYLRPAQ